MIGKRAHDTVHVCHWGCNPPSQQRAWIRNQKKKDRRDARDEIAKETMK